MDHNIYIYIYNMYLEYEGSRTFIYIYIYIYIYKLKRLSRVLYDRRFLLLYSSMRRTRRLGKNNTACPQQR